MAVISKKGNLVDYFRPARKKLKASGFTEMSEDRWERGEVVAHLISLGRGKCIVEFEYLDDD